jgi:hypothetical protein
LRHRAATVDTNTGLPNSSIADAKCTPAMRQTARSSVHPWRCAPSRQAGASLPRGGPAEGRWSLLALRAVLSRGLRPPSGGLGGGLMKACARGSSGVYGRHRNVSRPRSHGRRPIAHAR